MQTTTPHAETLSPWWKHAVILTLIGGFAVLIWKANNLSSLRSRPHKSIAQSECSSKGDGIVMDSSLQKDVSFSVALWHALVFIPGVRAHTPCHRQVT
jgi:hypothetical protein